VQNSKCKYSLRDSKKEDLYFLFTVSTLAMLPTKKRINSNYKFDFEQEYLSYKKSFIPEKIKIIQFKEEDVGRLRVVRNGQELYVGGIQILPSFQRKGIGTAIFNDLISEVAETNIPIRLEVSKYNLAAIQFYKRLGFDEAGKKEDDLIMKYIPISYAKK